MCMCALFPFQLWHYAFTEKTFSFLCQPVVWDNTPDGMFLAHCSYGYFWLKIFDWIDTLFFILRKKNGHLSFLHVYHHSMITLGVYIQAIFAPAGQAFIIGAINTFIHTVMYTYYLVTILQPKIRSNNNIKKTITKMQMVWIKFLFYLCPDTAGCHSLGWQCSLWKFQLRFRKMQGNFRLMNARLRQYTPFILNFLLLIFLRTPFQIQFGIIIVHSTYGIYSSCDYPMPIQLVVVLQNAFMLCLFGDFYYKNYVKKRKTTIKNANKTI